MMFYVHLPYSNNFICFRIVLISNDQKFSINIMMHLFLSFNQVFTQMILEVLVTIFILLSLALFKWCWIQPKKDMKFYENQFKAMKLKVKVYPYRFLYNGCFDPVVKGTKEGDPYKIYKQQFPGHAIALSNVMNRPFVELMDVQFIKDFFSVDKHYDYPKIEPIIKPFRRMLFGEGIGFSEGQAWKKKKALLNNVMNFEFLKSQANSIAKVCDMCFDQMQKHCGVKETQNGSYVECDLLQDLMIKIFSQVILTSFFGVTEKHYIQGEQASQFLNNIAVDLMEYQLKSITTFFGDWFYDLEFRKIDKSLNRRQKVLKQWGLKVIKEKIKQIQSQIMEKGKSMEVNDIIKAILVYKKDHNLPDNDPLVSLDEIYCHFVGFFLGGTDTTSNYTNAMILYLAKYPEIEKKVREQIEEFMKEDDYSYQNLKKFKYIDALQKQTTRVYGPGNIILVRQAARDNYVNGLAIKKGTLVTVNPYANHFSEEYFKDPFEFRPERWLNGECDSINPFVLIGFSAGARTCLGKHLALLQNKIAVIKILKRYNKIKIPNADFKMTFKFLQCPQEFKTKLVLKQ